MENSFKTHIFREERADGDVSFLAKVVITYLLWGFIPIRRNWYVISRGVPNRYELSEIDNPFRFDSKEDAEVIADTCIQKFKGEELSNAVVKIEEV